jgi:hypothetical protein
MKAIYKIFPLVLVALLAVSACTNNFEEINTRKDRLTTAEPEFFFGLTPVATLRELTSNNNWYFFGNYSNYWSVIGGSAPHFGFDGRGDRIWSNLYTSALNPIYNIIRNYGDNPAYNNRVAIAHIWRAYIFSQLTAIYGPCPYTAACNGESSIPYDKEEFVYRAILQELKDAYTALNPTGDKYPETAEPFLLSNIDRWAQFAHCIRLRTALRLAEVPDAWAAGLAAEARAIVAEELDLWAAGKLIANNTGNFGMAFGQELNNQNPLFRDVVDNPELTIIDPGNFPVIHESFSLWVREETYNDPCLSALITNGSGGTRQKPLSKHLGRPHSFERPQDYQPPQGWSPPYDGLKYGDFATIGRDFYSMTATFYFFSYAELCFIAAEAAYKGYWTAGKTAEEYYYDGIDARCTQYRGTASNITAYKNKAGIRWSTPSDTITVGRDSKSAPFRDYLGGFTDSYLGGAEDNFKRIVVQHWISLFSRNIDGWTLLRRTEAIPFKPHFGADQNNGNISGRWAYTPQRLVFPGSERSTNKEQTFFAIDNYLFDKGNAPAGQQDQVTYRLIFAKDNPGLPAPHPGTIAYTAYPYELPNTAKNRTNN